MVTLRRFTGAEWRDLGRGLRLLLRQDDEAIERNKTSTIEWRFIDAKKHREEMLELCELYAKRADRAGRP